MLPDATVEAYRLKISLRTFCKNVPHCLFGANLYAIGLDEFAMGVLQNILAAEYWR